MGNGQSCFGQPSCPERLQASDYDEEEKGGGLATSVINLMKEKCLLSRKRSGGTFHPLKKQNEHEKEIITDDHNANEQYPTLEQWLLSSPVSEKSSANSETHLFKHFSNRVHPALLDHIVSSPNQRSSFSKDKLLEEVNGQLVDDLGDVIPRSSLSRSQSERTKKRVSFRLPEKDEIIIYASPEVEGHDARARSSNITR
ncbi:hypothetical protein ACJRO7_022872 [Eucalyptus globulus]|uniref:Uncharacterized protein n=1 Tax=Eucalyptus globulus TaxID=34317 RepID=A0ABD3K4E3_EUCGL